MKLKRHYKKRAIQSVNNTKVLSTRAPTELAEKIEEAARSVDLTTSEFLLKILTAWSIKR